MSEVNLVEDELWDHYSGLPNPMWWQHKKELGEEDADIVDLENINKKEINDEICTDCT